MNTQQSTEPTGKQLTIFTQFRGGMEKMRPQFAKVMPAEQIDRFIRIAQTEYTNNKKLHRCSIESVIGACVKAAQDGLLPDGREGAIVPYDDTATWMPMIAGIRKLARNSGLFSDWYVELAYPEDYFYYQLGDDPRIDHRPNLDVTGSLLRPIKFVYSIAKFKDGTISRYVLPIQAVEDIKIRYARAKGGPWSDPYAYGEMAKKTCQRRHSKFLPLSTDLDVIFHRDDHLYNLEPDREPPPGGPKPRGRPRNALAALEQFAGSDEGADAGDADPPPGGPHESGDVAIDRTDTGIAALIADAEQEPPQSAAQFTAFVNGLLDAAAGAGDIDTIKTWWTSAAARAMRNTANMSAEDTSTLAARIKAQTTGGLDIPPALRRTREAQP